MTLKEAIKTLIDAKGLDVFKTPMSLNILSDFNAFEEHPASKNILKNIISEGYLDKIAFFYNNGIPVGDAPNTYATEMYHKLGFRSDISNYVLNAILEALGFMPISDYVTENDTLVTESGVNSIPASLNVKPNPGNHLEFKGVPINGSKDVVADAVEKMGFTFVDGGDDGALFNGKFAGIDNCQILVSSSPHTKQTYGISIFTPENLNWWGVKAEYDGIKSMLGKKYGRPSECTEFFSDPYELGDGYELTAFSTGNAIYVTKYSTSVGDISVMITQSAQLLISYSDKVNREEHEAAEGLEAQNDI